MTPERRIWHIGTAFTLLLLLLSCRMVYWQVVSERKAWADVPYAAVAGTQDADEHETATPTVEIVPKSATETPTPIPTIDLTAITRGTIYDRNGRRLAYDLRGGEGSLVRLYTEPSLAHVVGYISGVRAGVTGIEQAYDRILLGLDDSKGLSRQPVRGNDVYLTIDSRVQRAAAQALNGKTGAIVVMDAQSGAVLAMASCPHYDPNRILDPDYVRELENCDSTRCYRQALLNRAAQGWYTPGSTWKTITLIAALETGQVTPETVFDCGTPLTDEKGRVYYVYTVDGFPIRDPNHREQRLDLVRSYAISANAVFARIGDEMPAEVMIEYAARLGFSRQNDGTPPIEIDASAARVAINPEELRTNNLLRASTAIGQGELLASPLSMAIVIMAIVNDGDISMPHLIQSVKDPPGNLLSGEPVGYWIKDTMRPETAELVREFMVQAVRNGSGVKASVPGFVVGGKTGTAQLGDDSAPHAWFTGFVQGNDRVIAIAIIIENGGAGSRVAAPLCVQVADVAMHHLGDPVQEIVPEPTVP